jgi:hypothetical protein
MVRRLVTLIVAAAFLSGCSTPSVHPVWSKDKDLTDPALVGAWAPAEKDSKELYTVTRQGDAYHLVYKKTEKPEETREFDVRLVKLGAYRFADVTMPESAQRELSDRWAMFALPVHTFLRYSIDGDRLHIWCLDRKEFEAGLKAKTFTLAHTRTDDDTVLITAETPDIQAFLGTHAEDKDLFGAAELQRVKP